MVNSDLVVKHSFESKFKVTALGLTTVLCSNDGASPSLADGDTGGRLVASGSRIRTRAQVSAPELTFAPFDKGLWFNIDIDLGCT